MSNLISEIESRVVAADFFAIEFHAYADQMTFTFLIYPVEDYAVIERSIIPQLPIDEPRQERLECSRAYFDQLMQRLTRLKIWSQSDYSASGGYLDGCDYLVEARSSKHGSNRFTMVIPDCDASKSMQQIAKICDQLLNCKLSSLRFWSGVAFFTKGLWYP